MLITIVPTNEIFICKYNKMNTGWLYRKLQKSSERNQRLNKWRDILYNG